MPPPNAVRFIIRQNRFSNQAAMQLPLNHGAPSTRGHAPLLQVIDALGAVVRVGSS